MKRFLLIGMTLLVWSQMPAQAQTATDTNEGVRVTADAATGAQVLTWWGKAGRTYFVQQSYDLIHWTYVPVVRDGGAAVDGLNFASTDKRQFWRLEYTDVSTGGLSGAAADFDDDGLTNQQEVEGGTGVFNADTDGDGFSDGTEALAGTDAKAATSNPVSDLNDVPLLQAAFLLSDGLPYYTASSNVLQADATTWSVWEYSIIPGNIYNTLYFVNGGMPNLPGLPARPTAGSGLDAWGSWFYAGNSHSVSLSRIVGADNSFAGMIGNYSALTGTASKYKFVVQFPSRNVRTVKVVEQKTKQAANVASPGNFTFGTQVVTGSQVRTLTLAANATETVETVLQPDEADDNFMTTATVGPPVETLQPALAPYPLADPLVAAQQVRICRWRDAFGLNHQNFDPAFIGTDPDRVVFRVPQSEVDPAKPELRVSVTGIQGVAGQTSDTGVLALHLNNGSWESLPLIFVADPEDDQSFNGQAGLGSTNDGSVKTPNPDNDQTRLASFGATISVGYRKPGQTTDVLVPVATIAPARRTVQVKLHRFSQTGATSLNQGNEATIQEQFDFVRLIYRQIGIDVVQNGAIANHAYPADIWALVDSFSLDGAQKTPASAAHSNMTMFDYLDSLSGADTDINLYWIDDIASYTTSGRESDYISTAGEGELNGNTALLTLIATGYGRQVTGHELGHCLGLDHPSPANDSSFRLMHPGALSWPNDYRAPKRFYFTEPLFPNQ
ncbi:MAG: hypothetical protein K9N47_29780 [Prosthecobacter sp.]|uniref:hypothetical protein n=1 Tax=Prosthecobacter sp. TaxID=1965333 RepID=UPI00262BF566|nr:hypothetical protein [Prosthecobacter sp.]MCF7790347.1 hypothetical protein [Prosthecobacter sp.]